MDAVKHHLSLESDYLVDFNHSELPVNAGEHLDEKLGAR